MFPHELHSVRIATLPFLTDRQKSLLATLQCTSAWDLVSYTPRRYEDRSKFGTISLQCTQRVSAQVQVQKHSYIPFRNTRVLQVCVADAEMHAYLLCFGRNFLAKQLKVGQNIILYTQFTQSYGKWTSSQFEYSSEAGKEAFLNIQPIYQLKKGVRQSSLRSLMKKTIPRIIASIEDDIAPEKLAASGIEGIQELENPRSYIAAAYHVIHFPKTMTSIEAAKSLIALRELVRIQLRFSVLTTTQSYPLEQPLEFTTRMHDTLPFQLTASQMEALHDSLHHIQQNRAGRRIIQGDVGCGKTIVALLVAILLAQKGYQTIFLAPTYLLAIQHFKNNQALLQSHSLRSAFLHRNLSAESLRSIREEFLAGSIDILFGTHKLLHEDIAGRNLALLIIDEQQRFGVEQRGALTKSQFPPPYVLMLSATPIPRSVAHIISGYITVSTINEKPLHRKPVRTHLCSQKNTEQAYRLIDAELEKKHQAYIVYPRIAESEHIRSIESMLSTVQQRFQHYRCAMVHSQLDAKTIEYTMQEFAEGKIQVLLASSIIEVGIDVQNATILLVEHAELFGLATLHQLRGRIGRSNLQSYCCFSFAENLSDIAKERLKIIYETNDGFLLSEKDLLLRGPGDLVGSNQSGFSAFAFLLALKHPNLREASKMIASQILADTTEFDRFGIEYPDRESADSML